MIFFKTFSTVPIVHKLIEILRNNLIKLRPKQQPLHMLYTWAYFDRKFETTLYNYPRSSSWSGNVALMEQ